MKKLCFLTTIMLSTTVLARPDVPAMREEIARGVYVPSPGEQQKLTDAEYNAYRRSGLITRPRAKEKTETKAAADKETPATENGADKKTQATGTAEAKEPVKRAPVKQRKRIAVPKKQE